MTSTVRSWVLLMALAGAVSSWAESKDAAHDGHMRVTEADLVWTDGPPSLPPGAKVAALEGKPSDAGPFTLRIKMPAGYKIAPHHHPADEHVTVLTGTFSMGMGEAWDDKGLKDLSAGGFALMPKGVRHFAMSRDGATIQLHGIGPWGIVYVNPADDPRQQSKPAAK